MGEHGVKTFLKHMSNYKFMLLMMLPACLYVFVFSYLPMTGIVLAFKKFNYSLGIFASPWSGLANFKFLMISDKLWTLTRNTLLYNLAFIVVDNCLEVMFAIIISELAGKWFKKTFQTFMFLPYFISWVVAVSVVQVVLNYDYGLINRMLSLFGAERINTATNANIWPGLLVLLHAWKSVGYGSVVYLSSVTGIDPAMYEAAAIDGANIWQRLFRITLPSLTPTIVIMVLLSIGQIFRGDFGMFYQLVGTNGVLLSTTDMLDMYIYRAMAGSGNIGMSAAAGLYQSALCFATIMLANFLVKKIQPDYSLF